MPTLPEYKREYRECKTKRKQSTKDASSVIESYTDPNSNRPLKIFLEAPCALSVPEIISNIY
jgi:hypothetical protein